MAKRLYGKNAVKLKILKNANFCKMRKDDENLKA